MSDFTETGMRHSKHLMDEKTVFGALCVPERDTNGSQASYEWISRSDKYDSRKALLRS